MATGKRTKDISLEEVRLALGRSVAGADAARARALQGLSRLRSAKSAALAREEARLTQKYGAEDERTRAVVQRTAVNRVLVRTVAAEAALAAIDMPAPDPKAWILHGRVLDQNLVGVPTLTITLHDERGEWLREAGYACTDETGYYRLAVAGAKRQDAADAKREGFETARASVFLQAAVAKGVTLHKDPRPLRPRLGRIDYRQIVLGERATPCAPPER